MIALYILIILFCAILLFLAIKAYQLKHGRSKVEKELEQCHYEKMSFLGSVKKLSIMPLMDFYSDREGLTTEAGVSYLIKADDTTILMDMGYNEKKLHPSPLLRNIQTLGVNLHEIAMVFISHIHLDHVGGAANQKSKTFSISQGPVDIPAVSVFAPDNVSPSKWNPDLKVGVIKEPKVLKPGIASIGVIPRFLFLMGYTLEHSLAINVEGKGVVLIIGCGHQTIQRIIERAKELFNEPIYGIIGGLHFPVKGGRLMKGPLNIQHIVGSDNPPWNGLSEYDVLEAINYVNQINPKIVSLSPHDSSDWSLEQFRQTFKDKYVELKVGKEITI